MDLHVKGQNMATPIGDYPMFDQQLPEGRTSLGFDFALIGGGKAVDGEDGVVTKNQFVTGIRMLRKGCRQPSGLNITFAAQL